MIVFITEGYHSRLLFTSLRDKCTKKPNESMCNRYTRTLLKEKEQAHTHRACPSNALHLISNGKQGTTFLPLVTNNVLKVCIKRIIDF